MALEIEIYDDTLEGKKLSAAAQISKQITATLRSLIGQSRGISQQVFNNPQGLTPQQVCDAMGTDASKVLAAGQAASDMVNALRPNTMQIQIPAGFSVQPNQDGTVTIVTL
jgi:hypothetical protein